MDLNTYRKNLKHLVVISVEIADSHMQKIKETQKCSSDICFVLGLYSTKPHPAVQWVFSLFIFIVKYLFRLIKKTRTLFLFSIPTLIFFFYYNILCIVAQWFLFLFLKSLSFFFFCSGVCFAEGDVKQSLWLRICDTLGRVSAVSSHYSISNTKEPMIPSRFSYFG